MSSLIDPVGPQERGVYWRRRLILLGVLLVVVLLLARAFAGGDDSPTAEGTPAGSTSSTSPTATATATSSAKASSSASAGPEASGSASASVSASNAPVLDCKDSDVLVTARPQRANYAVGDTVNISYVISTKNGVRCKRDVGGAADEVRVVSGSNVIWSSDYCSPGGKKDVRTIGPDESFSVLVAWDGDVTASDCPDDRLPAPAGSYQVLGRNGTVFGPSAPLTLG